MASNLKEWKYPTVTEFDIAERTQLDPAAGDDGGVLGMDPEGVGGNGGDSVNGGNGGRVPGS